MATTFATFYTTYKDLALTGVTNLDEPPLSLTTAQCPAKWVDSGGLDEAPLRAKGVGGDRTLRGRIVVAMAPVGQDTHASRWSDTWTMADTLNTGIKTVASRAASWTIDVNPNFAERYFAVVATIEEPEGIV